MDALGCADHNPPPSLLANKETRTTKLRGGGGGVACKVTDDIVGKKSRALQPLRYRDSMPISSQII